MFDKNTATEVEVCFENAFKQYFRPLCFHAMTYLNEEELSKDIVGDAFAEFWDQRMSVDFSSSYPYLLCLVRNRCINHLKHKQVEKKYIERQLLFGETSDTNECFEREAIIQKIIARIEELPEKSKEVLKLYFLERKKQKEIAEILNISVNTVKTHITVGIRTLRAEFPNQPILFLLIKFKMNLFL